MMSYRAVIQSSSNISSRQRCKHSPKSDGMPACLYSPLLYVQRRALKIIFCYSSSTSYLTTLELAGILSLEARRVDLSKRFFRNICKPDNCLHHLLPPPRDLAVTSRLRKPTVYPRPILRTKRYC